MPAAVCHVEEGTWRAKAGAGDGPSLDDYFFARCHLPQIVKVKLSTLGRGVDKATTSQSAPMGCIFYIPTHLLYCFATGSNTHPFGVSLVMHGFSGLALSMLSPTTTGWFG